MHNQKETEKPAENMPNDPINFAVLLKDKAFQAEFDNRVSKALVTAKTSWEQETQKRIESARMEGEALAQMTAEERAKAEAESKVADILAREKEMDKREADIKRRELLAHARSTLAQRALPLELADVLSHVVPSAEAFGMCIDALEEAHRVSIKYGVEERLKSTHAPKAGRGEAVPMLHAMRAAAGLP
ncbi:MAG: DUF4355 domain-containing protein [Clostridia bacterium]|nr:DUF4355 domain-containing protein [Clostridia bacterium]